MKTGLVFLVLAYGLSQFYRAFLAVLSPNLGAEIGASPQQLATASATWFLIFAIMQIPVGAALDSIGPRRTATVLLAVGGAGGALMFAVAQTPLHISVAMGLIGIGCSPVLMASYYIFARTYSAAVFATLAGAIIGIGSLGNIAGSAPLAWAITAFGWRETMGGIAALTLLIAVLLWLTVRDPAPAASRSRGSVFDILRIPAFWLVAAMMFVCYGPAAVLRGLWAGPYATDVFGADARIIGNVTLVMGLAMIAGNFAYGPLDRLFRTRKWVIFGGNLIGALAMTALWLLPGHSLWLSTVLLALIGFAGSSFPVVVAHARAFIPPHLTGRGVTLINLFGIGGAGLLQFASGPAFSVARQSTTPVSAAYGVLFLSFALLTFLGLAIYAFAADRTD
jgi:predicted MFS family arabinose efflux permease